MGHLKDLLVTVYGGGDEAVAAAEKLAGLNRWIPVSERLPDSNCKVLTYGLQKYPVVCSFWADDQTFRDGGKVDGVTHWMNLPETPEVN